MRLIDADAIEWHDYLVADGNGMYHEEKVAYKSDVDCLPTITPPKWVQKVEHMEQIARQNPYIRNPLAWALYSVWKECDT